jgi:hypothetical protein
MSKTAPHPDAEIFALAEKCATANQRFGAAGDAFAEAEHRCADIKPPRALIKTEEDAKMRLFVLGCPGETYDRSEIAVIGAILRSLRNGGGGSCPAYRRGRAIIDSWLEWDAREEAEKGRSGYEAADRAQTVALRDLNHVVEQLATTPALTIDGLLAKARAFGHFSVTENLAKRIESQINEVGVLDLEPLTLSLASDMFSLAKAEVRS